MPKRAVKLSSSKSNAFISLLSMAILIISGSVVLSSSLSPKGSVKKSIVLSESSGSDDSSGSHGGSSGSGSSNTSGSSGSTSGSGGSEIKTPEPSGSDTGERSGGSRLGIRATEKPEVESSPEASNEAEIADNEVETETEVEVESAGEKVKVKLVKGKDKFEIKGENVNFLTGFPVSVDKTTGELTITTPAGVRTVAVLPEQAVENMLKNHTLDEVTSPTNNISVHDKNGHLEFQIEGVKNEKLLGVVDVKVPKSFEVSAENGTVLTTNQSLLSRILDLISF